MKDGGVVLLPSITRNEMKRPIEYPPRKRDIERLKNYLRRKEAENSSARLLMAVTDMNSRQAQLLQILREKPATMFTVREIEQRFAVTNATARTDLRGLVERGFLVEVPMNKVKRGYVRSADFEARLAGG